jgi:DNA-binding response OmpR family regulator
MIPNKATLDELEALRQRVEELEFELGLLKATADAEVAQLMDAFDLTCGEAQIIRALAHARGSPLSRVTLVDALGHEINELRTIDSHIKRIRKKVGKNLPIDTLYGLGYRLTPATAKRVRDIMDGKIAPEKHRVHFYREVVAA